MEVEKPAEEFSKEDLRRQLYTSLRSTGVLDSMKGQLRARLLEHLRHHDGESMEVKRKQGKPSLTERLLSSLFLDYLECNGFTFTISVFMPESQMASWRPFAYQEMLELLHLDPSSDLHIRLKLGGEGRECLAHQLVTVLQQMAQRNCITEVSTQTSPAAEVCKHATRTSCTSPKDLERSMEEVEDAYVRKQEAQRALPYRALEDKITILHQEFDARVNAEVALQFSDDYQVSRLRDYEINAARMNEAARYRRQLARDREELEDIHKSRMDRIKAREESLLERMLSKEKAFEASAYEQRQKLLSEITSLRERENKLRQFKESQERREEKLDDRELSLSAKEEEVVRVRKTLYAQADEITALRRKELEGQYKELCDCLQHDRTLLEAEREQMKEEKTAMAIELAASRSDKELIQALHHRLRVEEDQRLNLVKANRELEAKLEEKLRLQRSSAPAPVNILDQRLEERLRELQSDLEQERFRRQAIEKESKTLERKLQQKKVELAAARAPQGEWITEHKNLMATIHLQDVDVQKKETQLQLMEIEKEKLKTRHKKLLLRIDHLDTLVKEAQEEKDRAIHDLGILQDQHKTTERELLETVTLLRKAKQALEVERLDHCALKSHKKTLVPSISVAPQRVCASQDKHEQNNSLFEPRPSADEIIRKKWESFQRKPRQGSHDLWTHGLFDNAAKKVSHDQSLAHIPINHFPASTISKPFSSGFGNQLLEMRNTGSPIELNEEPNWKTSGEVKRVDETDMNGWKAIAVEELSTVKGGITSVTKTEALLGIVDTRSIEDIFTTSWDGERNCEDAIPSWKKTPLLEVARPGSWNNGHEESESEVIVTSRQSEFDIGVRSITRDSGSAWNLGHSGDRSHKDGVHSQGMAFFQREKKMAENYDYKESLSSLQDLEMSAEICMRQIPSLTVTSTWGLKDSQQMKPLEARHMESFKGVTTTVTAQRDTAMSTIEIECKGGLSNLYTRDICVLDNQSSIGRPKTDIGHNCLLGTESGPSENLQLSKIMGEDEGHDSGPSSSFPPAMHRVTMKMTGEGCDNQQHEGSKEDNAASKDGKEPQASVLGFSTTNNFQTSMDIVRNTDLKKDARIPWDPEEHNINRQSNEMSSTDRTSPEPTKRVANHKESLTVDSDTKDDDEHMQEGAENSWNLYLGEEEVNTRENSEAEEGLGQDFTPSCKYSASLKHNRESLEESTQSRDELLMSGSCGPRMNSQSEGEQHETVESATEVPKILAMEPAIDNIRPLRLSAQSVDSNHLICEDNPHNNRSEINSKAVGERTKQAIQGDEAREMDAGLLLPSDPLPCEAHEPMKLTNEINQVAVDLTRLVPIPTESEETSSNHSSTPSIGDGNFAQDPDKDLNKLMRCLGHTNDKKQRGSNKKEDEPLSQKALNLNSQNEDSRSLMQENVVSASGKMSGLPEMGETLYKQEMQQAREKAQKNLPDHLLQDSAMKAQDPVEVKDDKNISLNSPLASKPPGHVRHALETLQTSIVMKKQELPIDREIAKESPRLMDWMNGHKSHPTLALAIRNNRLVKLETQDEFKKTPRSSLLNVRHVEATIYTKDEKQFGKETTRLVGKSSNIRSASETNCTPAPCGETHSFSEESIYQGDSFEEEEEDEGDREPAYSEESCTNAAMRGCSGQIPGLLGLETNERSSPRSQPQVEGAERSSANWEGESEQGSFSPDEDDRVAELPV